MAVKTIDTSKQETNSFGETYLPDVNSATFNAVPSEVLFKKYFSELKDNFLRIILGTDSGLLVNYINIQAKQKNAYHIFIEHPEVIEYINANISYDTNKIRLLSFDDDLSTYIKQNFPVFFLTSELYLSKSFSVIDKQHDYDSQFNKVLEWFNSFLAKRSLEIGDNLFIDTTISVQAFLDNSAAILEKKIEGIPALILGGGPTLDENIEWIKVNQSKFIVIAVGRITHRLSEEGIIPDAIMTIDPTELSFSNSKDTLSFSDKSLLVSSNHPNYKLTGQWQGRSVYMGQRLAIPTVNNPPCIMPRGNTVSNFAAQFAMVIGCRDIYLAGVDFCYLASGQSHEGKSLEFQTGVSSDISTLVENFAGQMVGSNSQFELARMSFNIMIRDFKSAFEDLHVYSLSNRSAFMEHVEYKNTQKINLSNYRKDSKSCFLEALDSNLLTSDTLLIKDLDSRSSELQKLIKKIDKVQTIIHKKLNQLNPEWTDLDFINSQLYKITSRIEEALSPPLLEMIKTYGFQKLITKLADKSLLAKENNSLLELDRISYLNLISDTISALSKVLKKSEKHINIRRAEIKQSLSADLLIEYWLENDLPGRIFIWKAQFPELYRKLKSQHPALFEQTLQAYDNQFKSSKSVQQNLEKKSKDIQYFLKKINEYKNKADTELLNGLKKQFNQTESRNFEELNHYLEATIHYLEKDYTQALQLIKKVSHRGIIQFNALQLQLTISMTLKNHQTTLETFLKLCEYSASYMPNYADFLKLMGDSEASIEIYKMYLQIMPNDTESIVKLFQLITETKSQDEAKLFLKQQQKQMPDNPTINNIVSLL